jgi:hypothetical protein
MTKSKHRCGPTTLSQNFDHRLSRPCTFSNWLPYMVFSVVDQKMLLARHEPIRDMQIAFACENDNLPTILEVISE